MADVLPGARVIEAQPRPGELPTIAMDTVLPGCAAAVISASSVVNRTLPRILRLAAGARSALIGPATPMTPRLHTYGTEVLGGLRVRDPDGLAASVAAGGRPAARELKITRRTLGLRMAKYGLNYKTYRGGT